MEKEKGEWILCGEMDKEEKELRKEIRDLEHKISAIQRRGGYWGYGFQKLGDDYVVALDKLRLLEMKEIFKERIARAPELGEGEEFQATPKESE